VAIDEGRKVRGEKHGDAGDVVWLASNTDGIRRDPFVNVDATRLKRFKLILHAGRVDDPGCDRIDPDSPGPQFERVRTGHGNHRSLRRAVRRDIRTAAERGDRSHVHDGSAVGHASGRFSRGAELCPHVDLEHLVNELV